MHAADHLGYFFNRGIAKMKKTLITIIIFVVVAVFLSMEGCRLIGSGIARLTSDFNVLRSDNRILYEEGAEALAEAAARYLPKAIADVKLKQYGSLQGPVKVYVFASSKSFAKFAGTSDAVLGAGLENEIFLSGKLLNTMDKAQGILTHELSHVQLSQVLGIVKFNRALPRWFREGLAVYVANGGGATRATEAEAIDKFVEGKHFTPETKGALLNVKLDATGKLEPKIFYRQSGMFVQFLADNYPVQFESMLKGLQEGKDFQTQYIMAFKNNVDEELKYFIANLKGT
jgi:hypothetical protein